jgi:hypothetical protein
MEFLGQGLRVLLGPAASVLAPAAIDFLIDRIGARNLMAPELQP